MSFRTASAILKGYWFIEPAYVQAHLPLLIGMLKGENQFNENLVRKKAESDISSAELPGRIHYATAQSTGVFSVTPFTNTDRLPYNSIAQIDILGPVLKYGDYCSFGSMELNDLLIRMANSDRVKGVILNFDSPGGQADGCGTFADTIRAVSKIKPVLSIVQDGMCASAAMWIATSAQEVYLTRNTDRVGSIGAYCRLVDISARLEQDGIKVIDVYAPQSTDKNKEHTDAIAGDDSLLKNELKFLVEEFKKDVIAGRGQRLRTDKEDPFTGKMYRSKDALKMGLIDGIKPFAAVITRMENLISLRA